ncbi:MAG: nucleoside-diphosphate kinase [Candidatus Moranbacteria bacterium]|nr:nucleoside-diphosphate kinase [Candidatus Moranbacteria bacterium]
MERTLVLAKPDAVKRAIVGSIIKRFERAGLKLIGLKMLQASKEQLSIHFPIDDISWIGGMGSKSLEIYRANGMDPEEEFGTSDPIVIGRLILGWNFEYLLSGPVVAMVLEGVRAITVVRKIIGDTIPAKALPGTIRGDFSINSADFANSTQCSCNNVVHASGNPEEAQKEINLWFKEEELSIYKRADEGVMFFNKIR